ncbi:MAG: hypothetical protein H7Z43_02215, partial [Clostridia bacterium]|nr:hypothetical protein [Deltaproteobacteria bacterium]
MRIAKRILKILGYGLAGLIGLVVVAVVGTKLYVNEERLASFAVDKLNTLFAGRFSVRTVHWSLPFRFSLEDVSVDDPAGRPAIRATRVDATFDVKALIAGTIAITDIAGHGLDVRIVSMPNAPDAMGLVEAFGPKTPQSEVVDDSPSTIKLRVSGTSITEIEFTYDMPSMRFVLQGGRMENVAYGMHGDVMDIDGHVTVAQAEVAIGNVRYSGPFDLMAQRVAFNLGPSGKVSDILLEAQNIHANLAGLTVQTHGTMRFPAVDPLPQGTLALEATIPLEHPLVRQFGSGHDKGTVKLNLDMRREG